MILKERPTVYTGLNMEIGLFHTFPTKKKKKKMGFPRERSKIKRGPYLFICL